MNIEQRLQKLEAEVLELKYKNKVIWRELSMDTPEWAYDAAKAAEDAGLVPNINGGSYDFYRLLVLMHHKGLFDK